MAESNLMGARLRAQLEGSEGLKELDKVVEKHGRVEGEPFSFKGHEFQREIIRDTRSRIYVRKCSQVGLTELAVQKTLAMCAVMQHKRIIFTMPVLSMAQRFSKDRVDSVLEQSDYYKGMVVKASNSASLKKIGSNYLYIGGTYGDSSAISVPAEVVINDEVNFSNDLVLGKLSSRLRHASKDEMGYQGQRIMFSTPTLEDYGIDVLFKKGHQAYYMVKCKHCGSWEYPDFFEDFVVPGFDKPMIDIERRDIENPKYDFQKTWIKCSQCSKDLWKSILDPANREWVAKHPDRWEHSYQVSPIDVPSSNTPAGIMLQVADYPRFDDFVNFTLGLNWSSPDSNFLVTPEHRQRVEDGELWAYGSHVVSASTVMGLDVGKTCHLVVMVRVGKQYQVVWAEAIPNTIQKPATEAVINRFDFFKCRKLVIDAGPDITLVNQLVGAKGLGQISACQYVRSIPGLDIISAHDDGQLIKADRSKTLEDTMRNHNLGNIHYPKPLVEDVFGHLKNIKKVRKMDASGDYVDRFEATGDDHFGHALNYAFIASRAVDEFYQDKGVSMPPMVGKLKVK
jgi:predicted nucleic-acid-binding Zn-ribbon protein